jgi:glucan phosphorylase
VYATPDTWTWTASVNVACSGAFSSDRAMNRHASCIWHMSCA